MTETLIRRNSETKVAFSVASFLVKTFEILEKSQFSHIISWVAEDGSFAIKNILQFTNQILPRYFRHRNFSSFVRQLNMYDFHKVKQSNDYVVFRNALFQKEQGHLLRNIKRKAPRKNNTERKIHSFTGSEYVREGKRSEIRKGILKQSLQEEVGESMLLLEKSLLSLETFTTTVHQYIASSNVFGKTNYSTNAGMLDALMETKKLAQSSFKSLEALNSNTIHVLKQKHQRYLQLTPRLSVMGPEKNASTGSHSNTSSVCKSECSIGKERLHQ